VLIGHPPLLPMAAALGVIGFASGGIFPLLGVIIVRGFGAHSFGRILGTLMPVLVIVNAVSPFIAASIRDHVGSYVPDFAFCVGYLVVGAIAVIMLRVPVHIPRGDLALSSAPSAP
jgi:MFS family permease